MFCPKCGKQLADGELCTCSLNEAPAAPKAAGTFKLNKLNFGFLMSAILATFTLFLSFTDWYSAENFGISLGMSAYMKDIGELNAMVGLTKVFLITAIVLYFIYMVTKIIDFNALIPAIGNIDISKFAGLAYYVIFFFCFLFSFIGCCMEDQFTMSFAWFFALAITLIAIINIVAPRVLKNIFIKSLKAE